MPEDKKPFDMDRMYADMEESWNDGMIAASGAATTEADKDKTLTKGEVLRRLREKFKDKSGD